jgi:hypothetical protein
VKRFLADLVMVGLLLGAGAWLYSRMLPPRPAPPSAEELERLVLLREGMEEQLEALVAEGGEHSLSRAPRADVMVGISTRLTRSIAEHATTGLFGETRLVLREINVHTEGDVSVHMLLGRQHVGHWDLAADIEEARALLRPQRPTLEFEERAITLALPVDLAEGEGKVRLHFVWDSRGLPANVVCGDLDVTKEVTGRVKPGHYAVKGSFALSVEGGGLTLTPEFPDVALPLFVEPSEQAWEVVDEVVAEQRAGCRRALASVNVKGLLGKVLEKGFQVKIPRSVFRPIHLPAGLRQSLDVQGVKLSLDLRTTDLLVGEERLWYGANVGASTPSAR